MKITPQEKAKYLISIHSLTILGEMGNKLNVYEVKQLAKQFALIAVDEKYAGIINVIVDLKGRGCIDDKTFLKALDDMNTEWEQVKQELCK